MQGLREWPAFVDCKTTIDTFLAGLPLLQSLAHKSMRPRHWKEVMRVTATELNLAEDVLRLQHLLDAQLVKHQDEVRLPLAVDFGVKPRYRPVCQHCFM